MSGKSFILASVLISLYSIFFILIFSLTHRPYFLFSPQYLHESGLAANGKVIGITQPRRVAATTVCYFFRTALVLGG